jgi:hypothetical protein
MGKHIQIVLSLDRKKPAFKYIWWPISRGADCYTDHYLVVAKDRQRLSVSKRAAQKFDTERFNLKRLNEVEVKE